MNISLYMRSVSNQHVNLIGSHLSRQNRDLMLHWDLPDQVAYTKRHLPRQHLLAVLWDPHQLYLQIVLRVRSQLAPFHATTLRDPILRLARRRVARSPREMLIRNRAREDVSIPERPRAQGNDVWCARGPCAEDIHCATGCSTSRVRPYREEARPMRISHRCSLVRLPDCEELHGCNLLLLCPSSVTGGTLITVFEDEPQI